jgi:putative ABC transport system permease protein
VLTAISAVALMIGGIGVMNIMLVSVTERTKRDRDPQSGRSAKDQHPIAVLDRSNGPDGHWRNNRSIHRRRTESNDKQYSPLPAYIPIWAIIVGLLVSAGVGVVFWTYPAWKAANLDPIDALRFE